MTFSDGVNIMGKRRLESRQDIDELHVLIYMLPDL